MIDYSKPILAMVLALGLTACGGSESEPAGTEPTSESAAATESAPAAEPASAAESAPAQTPSTDQSGGESSSAEAANAGSGSAADAGSGAAGSCEFDMTVDDTLNFSATEISASADCTEFTLNLTHEGNLPASAMGHNWVLVPEGTAQEIATAGMSAGLDGDYLPDDDRIIAATEIIGGGESTSVTFSLEGLSGAYTYVCTFPGHWGTMQGTFTVEG